MSTNGFISKILCEVNLNASTASPQNFVAIPEVTELSGFGATTPLVRMTHFQSAAEEYKGGLPDGDEFSITCNRVHSSPNYQESLMDSLKGLTRTMRVTETDDSVSPNTTKTYTFDVVILGWSAAPGVGDRQAVSLNFKITGDITFS